SIVFLLPYLVMFAAFLRLRSIDPATPRPYRVPGGNGGAWVFAILCMLFILQAIVFFIYTPGEFDLNYAGSVLIGVLVTIVIGEGLVRWAERKFAG
ncbi:MAG: amino acid permease, partial [Parvibaculum sp.]